MTQEEGDPNVPSTAFIFADQSLVYDHWTQQWYLVGLSDHSSHGQEEVSKWMNQVKQDIQSMRTTLSTTTTTSSTTTTTTTNPSTPSQNQNKQPQSQPQQPQHPIQFVLHQSRDQYQQDIDTCHEYIRQGESYELCVTNQFEVTIPSTPKKNQDPFGLYMVLQHLNPAPFLAFFNFNAAPIHLHQNYHKNHNHNHNHNHNSNNNNNNNNRKTKKDDDSSFPRSASLAICCSSPERFISVKPFQQDTPNNMTNDDDDNDGSGTSKTTSHTQSLVYQVESKPIKGAVARYQHNDNDIQRIRDDGTTIKKRKGSFSRWKVSIGGGGAITDLSDSEDEYEEMLLKTRAVVESVQAWYTERNTSDENDEQDDTTQSEPSVHPSSASVSSI